MAGNLCGGVALQIAVLAVICIYLLGLLERRDRTVLRMGYDSIGVLGRRYFLG